MEDKKLISDELLAAFLEGNTSKEETLQVLHAIKNDPFLRDIVEIASAVGDKNDFDIESMFVQSEPLEHEEIYCCRAVDCTPMSCRLASDQSNAPVGNLCGVRCERYVLSNRGISVSEGDLVRCASDNKWLTPEGTPMHALGQLLAHHGLLVSRRYDADVADIVRALSLNNEVIVAVDSEKLYEVEPDYDDSPNHAVVVVSVDSSYGTITLYDPSRVQGHESHLQTVPIPRFLHAWIQSCCYMVRVLRNVSEYEPTPINLDSVSLSDDLLQLREAIAENAHDVWAVARMNEGWRYGEQRDDIKRYHPDLIPYSALSDSEKEYDRLMAINTIKLVKKLGYEIKKK